MNPEVYREKCFQAKGRQCEICGSEENIHVHHINGDRTDNCIKNLAPVCASCHHRIHQEDPEFEHWWKKLPAEKEGPMPGVATSLKITDERERKLERASEIVAADQHDDPPMSVVIDAALAHLLESERNIDDARGEFDPETIQAIANTSVIGLRYRTSLESKWR